MATKQKRYVKVRVRVGNKFLLKWKDTKTGKTYWNKPTFDHTRQSKPGLGVPTDKKTTERQKEGWKKNKEWNKSQGGGELGAVKAQKQVNEIEAPTPDEGYGAHVRGQQKKNAPKDTVKITPSDTSETNTEKKEEKKEESASKTNQLKSKTKLGEQLRRTKERIKKLSTKEERRKRRDARLKKKKNALKINKK